MLHQYAAGESTNSFASSVGDWLRRFRSISHSCDNTTTPRFRRSNDGSTFPAGRSLFESIVVSDTTYVERRGAARSSVDIEMVKSERAETNYPITVAIGSDQLGGRDAALLRLAFRGSNRAPNALSA